MFAKHHCNIGLVDRKFSEYANSGRKPRIDWQKSLRLAVLIIFSVIAAGMSQAQTANTGAITGTILDQSGAVIPDADVAVTSESNASVRKVTTGNDGVYRVSLLPPGSYRIEATKDG